MKGFKRWVIIILLFCSCIPNQDFETEDNFPDTVKKSDTYRQKKRDSIEPPEFDTSKPDTNYECESQKDYEVCNNGVDDDCDRKVDEDCPCAYHNIPVGVCNNQRTNKIGQCSRPTHFQKREGRCDNLDNDCDGKIDEPEKCNHVCVRKECEMVDGGHKDADGSHYVFKFACTNEPKSKLLVHPTDDVTQDGYKCWTIECVENDTIFKQKVCLNE